MFAGSSVVSDLLFAPIDIGETLCYNYLWWYFLFYIVLSEVRGGLQGIGDNHWGVNLSATLTVVSLVL